MNTLAVCSLVRNEAQRWLPSALRAWTSFADEIVVLDDNSDDNTVTLCRIHDARVEVRKNLPPAWGAESEARRRLFELGTHSRCEWLLFLDADMVPASDPKELLTGSHTDHVYFPLYDLWHEDDDGGLHYRSDALWFAHTSSRVWAVRNPLLFHDHFKPRWSERGLHCGHLPENIPLEHPIFAPKEYALLHYGYLRISDRADKHGRYMQASDTLNDFEVVHANSIIDEAPNLKPLPVKPQWKLTFSAEPRSG